MKADHASFLCICLVSLSRFSVAIFGLHLVGFFQSKQNKQTEHSSPVGLLGWMRGRGRFVRREDLKRNALIYFLGRFFLISFLGFF